MRHRAMAAAGLAIAMFGAVWLVAGAVTPPVAPIAAMLPADVVYHSTPTAATGAATIAAAASETYSWTISPQRILICSAPNCPATLYVRFGSAAASTTAWDLILQPGDIYQTSGIAVASVSIYADVETTYGTHVSIKAWAGAKW